MPEVLFAGEEGRDGVSYGDYLGADDLGLVVQDPLNPSAQLGLGPVPEVPRWSPLTVIACPRLGRHGEPGEEGKFLELDLSYLADR